MEFPDIEPDQRLAAISTANVYLLRVIFRVLLQRGLISRTDLDTFRSGIEAGDPSKMISFILEPLLKAD